MSLIFTPAYLDAIAEMTKSDNQAVKVGIDAAGGGSMWLCRAPIQEARI